eukprot:156358-Amorphochlora_amoeboformis.AAC.1
MVMNMVEIVGDCWRFWRSRRSPEISGDLWRSQRLLEISEDPEIAGDRWRSLEILEIDIPSDTFAHNFADNTSYI